MPELTGNINLTGQMCLLIIINSKRAGTPPHTPASLVAAVWGWLSCFFVTFFQNFSLFILIHQVKKLLKSRPTYVPGYMRFRGTSKNTILLFINGL
jgi:hypothetical protein